ncbi:MAG: hypothetical protein WCO60_10610 [Verrucomicrobiota bacterium]
MKQTFPILTVAAALLMGSTAAHAKGKKEEPSTGTYGVAKFDVNENGIFEPEELEAIRKAFTDGDPAIKLLDTNNNGKLDDAELAAIKPPSAKKKKKKDAA